MIRQRQRAGSNWEGRPIIVGNWFEEEEEIGDSRGDDRFPTAKINFHALPANRILHAARLTNHPTIFPSSFPKLAEFSRY